MDKDSQSSAGGANTEQRGIFSTPELTVDTEKIAESTAAATEASRAKIASIFANTETGKQSQRLNDAMIANSQPATEDVVIDNGPRKKKRWPLVLTAVVLVGVIVGVVTWSAIKILSQQQEPITPLDAFNDYEEYLQKGPESMWGGADSGDWLIFQVGNNANFLDAEVKEYIETLQSKFNIFSQIVGDNKEQLGNINLDQYSRFLELYAKVATLNNLKQGLLNKYLDSGQNSAYNYINEIAPVQPADEEYRAMIRVSEGIKAYLTAELGLIEIYNDWGCINNHVLSVVCGTEFSDGNNAFKDLMEQQASAASTITGYAQVLQEPFKEMTSSISKVIEGQNV